ncbi:MAG: hypothetical protein PHC64_07470 [Candidatus Gastranaerophilales bacterium]|nr:hypothetical protein [Candidatus Gastranaerophilales bacterium]
MGSGKRIKVTCLFEKFMTPPYGLTKSIVSVLLLDVLARNKDILAVYENGQFQLKLSALMFDRMVYCPQNFELQKTVMEDLPILENISEIILPCKSTNILDLTKGLIYFIKNLDKYTLNTERLSKNTIRFRNAVLNAKDPINLFYKDIPKILDDKRIASRGRRIGGVGLCEQDEQDNPETHLSRATKPILCQCDKPFVKAFDEAIQELQNSYSNLIKEISTFLFESFICNVNTDETLKQVQGDVRGVKVGWAYQPNNKELQENLAKRFEAVQEFLSDNELKILHNNIKELNSFDTLWIERIATFINKSRVPKDWSDNDVSDFKIKVKELALKFTTIEATACIDFSEKELSKEFQKLLNEVLNLNKSERYLLMKKVVNM